MCLAEFSLSADVSRVLPLCLWFSSLIMDGLDECSTYTPVRLDTHSTNYLEVPKELCKGVHLMIQVLNPEEDPGLV